VLLMEEVKANMSFSHLKRGDRLQVDIHDPYVAGLVRGGYLTIIWKEPSDAGAVEDPFDPGWADSLLGGSVDAGALQEAEAQVDGTDQDVPVAGDRDGAPTGGSTDSADEQPDDSGGTPTRATR
jgi:hypothetical protein